MAPLARKAPLNVQTPEKPSLVTGTVRHWKVIKAPLTAPATGPALFGPLQLPPILFPDCRMAHTGEMLVWMRLPVIVPRRPHVPAKFAASAGPRDETSRANMNIALA
jgi:hypothetical protein